MVKLNNAAIGIYLVSYILAIVGGHFIVRWILKKYSVPKKGLEKAGAIIGVLERIFTLTFILIGQYTPIALIFTAKSITRFEDLKRREFAEYYLIGTLSSILIAMLIGIFTNLIVKFY